jgi:uncharacterized protein (DUF1330 family)
MPAYVIVDVDIHDPVRYRDYMALTPATIHAHGGRFVVRGGETHSIEGDWRPGRIVVLEFPSMERAKEWYASSSYREAMAIRHATANTRMIFVEGVTEQPRT